MGPIERFHKTKQARRKNGEQVCFVTIGGGRAPVYKLSLDVGNIQDVGIASFFTGVGFAIFGNLLLQMVSTNLLLAVFK